MEPRPTVVRVQGLPRHKPEETLREVLDNSVNGTVLEGGYRISVVPACDLSEELVALIDFPQGLPDFLSGLYKDPRGSWQVPINDGEDDLSFDRHFRGFTQLYPTDPSKPVDADVIAICGLDGHGYGSWQGRGNTRRMWLRHFLSRDLPNCRTMTYGYDAKLTSRDFSTVEDYVDEFLEDLKTVRQGEAAQRPIIFIAHSLGGIILARFLVKISTYDVKDNPLVAQLYQTTYSIIFFATPHSGLDVEDMSRIMGEESHPRTGLLQYINVASAQLAVQLRDFTNALRDRKVISFYETEQSKRLIRNEKGEWKREGKYFTSLDRENAVLRLPMHTETRIPVHRDHSAIVKYDSKQDECYKRCLFYLREFVMQAPAVIKSSLAADTKFEHVRYHTVSTNSAPTTSSKRTSSHSNHTTPNFSLSFGLPGAPMIDTFTGRQDELQALNGMFSESSERKVVILYGLGGVGKTQLAIEFARQQRCNYTAIIWIDARNEHSLQQSFRTAASRIAAEHESSPIFQRVATSTDIIEIIGGVLSWLGSPANNRWLMVFDNVGEDVQGETSSEVPFDAITYFPITYHGHILMTTRSHCLMLGERLPIKPLQKQSDRLKILQNRSGRADLESSASAKALVDRLEGLPLALTAAGAYLQQVPISITEYLQEYERSWLELQETTPTLPEYQGLMLQTTWGLSYAQVESKKPEAARLLSLWAYLGSQDVWYDLLAAAKTSVPDWFRVATESKLAFSYHMRILVDHGLVEVNHDKQSYGMHSCVHDWVCSVLGKTVDEGLASLALSCISENVDISATRNHWDIHRRLLGHALHICKRRLSHLSANLDNARYLHNVGHLFRLQHNFSAAEDAYNLALSVREEMLPFRHPLVAETVYSVGLLYMTQGLLGFTRDRANILDRAVSWYTRALSYRQIALGSAHPSTLETQYNLAVLFDCRGFLGLSERLFHGVMLSRYSLLGPDHPLTVATYHCLGALYIECGLLGEGRHMYFHAYKGYKKCFGPIHELTKMTRRCEDGARKLLTQKNPYFDVEQLYNSSFPPPLPLLTLNLTPAYPEVALKSTAVPSLRTRSAVSCFQSRINEADLKSNAVAAMRAQSAVTYVQSKIDEAASARPARTVSSIAAASDLYALLRVRESPYFHTYPPQYVASASTAPVGYSNVPVNSMMPPNPLETRRTQPGMTPGIVLSSSLSPLPQMPSTAPQPLKMGESLQENLRSIMAHQQTAGRVEPINSVEKALLHQFIQSHTGTVAVTAGMARKESPTIKAPLAASPYPVLFDTPEQEILARINEMHEPLFKASEDQPSTLNATETAEEPARVIRRSPRPMDQPSNLRKRYAPAADSGRDASKAASRAASTEATRKLLRESGFDV